MTEEKKAPDNGSTAKEKEKSKEVRLVISKSLENGVLNVTGPGNGEMYDKYVCFGLMEDAKDFIKGHNARASKPRIIPGSFKGAFGGRRR